MFQFYRFNFEGDSGSFMTWTLLSVSRALAPVTSQIILLCLLFASTLCAGRKRVFCKSSLALIDRAKEQQWKLAENENSFANSVETRDSINLHFATCCCRFYWQLSTFTLIHWDIVLGELFFVSTLTSRFVTMLGRNRKFRLLFQHQGIVLNANCRHECCTCPDSHQK